MNYLILFEGVGRHAKGEIVNEAAFAGQVDRLIGLGAIAAVAAEPQATHEGGTLRVGVDAVAPDRVRASGK